MVACLESFSRWRRSDQGDGADLEDVPRTLASVLRLNLGRGLVVVECHATRASRGRNEVAQVATTAIKQRCVQCTGRSVDERSVQRSLSVELPC